MSKIENSTDRSEERDFNETKFENHSSVPDDLPDSARDREELKEEETFIDLPDVKDIPGQEFINTLSMGELGDTTISSADEEGDEIFEEDSDEIIPANNDNVSRGEKRALNDTEYLPTKDENNLRNAALDNTDFQGEPLNERSFGDERSASNSEISDNS